MDVPNVKNKLIFCIINSQTVVLFNNHFRCVLIVFQKNAGYATVLIA